jgi:hypothetical protein
MLKPSCCRHFADIDSKPLTLYKNKFQINEYSEFFYCEIGVEQGENLSPFLFSLYLNDLEFVFI